MSSSSSNLPLNLDEISQNWKKITRINSIHHYHYHLRLLGADLVSHLDELEPLAGSQLELLGVDDLVDEV